MELESKRLHDTNYVIHRGGCHWGAVASEVEALATLDVSECNCSVCAMTGCWHLIVPRSQLRLLRGEDQLAEYRFNAGTARHLFCRVFTRVVSIRRPCAVSTSTPSMAVIGKVRARRSTDRALIYFGAAQSVPPEARWSTALIYLNPQ
jgi:hypothetical protein